MKGRTRKRAGASMTALLTAFSLISFEALGGVLVVNAAEIPAGIEEAVTEGGMTTEGLTGYGALSEEAAPEVPAGTTPEVPTEGEAPEVPMETTTPETPTEGAVPEVPMETTTPETPTEGESSEMPTETTTPEASTGDETPKVPTEATAPEVSTEVTTPGMTAEGVTSEEPKTFAGEGETMPLADSVGNGEELTEGDFAGWSWNVFGNSAKGTMEQNGSGEVTLTATGGKIASANDGICFLNKMLSSGTDNFILNATVNISEFKANDNQVALGLMMRAGVGTTSSEGVDANGVLRHAFVGVVNQKLAVSVRNGKFSATPFESSDYAKNTNYNLTMQKQGDTVTMVCDGQVQTIDLSGNSYDDLDLYVGLFVARNCKATFSNVSLQVIPADQTPELVSKEEPAKTQYIKGNTAEDIDLNGFSAIVKVGGENRTIQSGDCRIKSYHFDEPGDSKIVLDYLGLEIEIPITVIVEVVDDMILHYAPTKTDYFVGDEIDWTGFDATVTYNSGVTRKVQDLIADGDTETVVTGFDSTTAGEKTVVVTHTHGDVFKEISFKVNISGAVLESITLSGPTITTYYTDGTYSEDAYKEGLRITAVYDDGTKEIITNMNSAGVSISPASGVDITTTGETEYTVSYQVGNVTKTATYKLKVVESQIVGVEISAYPTTTTFAKGTSFSAAGLKVVSVKDSGVKTELTEGEYTIDSSAFQKDTVGNYTITITENVSGKSYQTTYNVAVEEKTSYGYEDMEWAEILFGQSVSGGTHPVYDASKGIVTVELGEGKGKITDAGQDGISYYYTTVDAGKNFVLTAEVKVDYFITKASPDNQEGFGLMVRDAIGTDNDASIFYSSAATVGGYYGRYNVFGRYGITPLDQEGFTNFYLYSKAGNTNYKITEDAPKTFTMTIAKDNTGIWASMVDEDGNDVLAPGSGNNPAKPANKVYVDKSEPYRVYMPTDTFTSIEPDKIYVGFMAARGAKLEVDTSTIHMSITSAASDAPQEVLPAAPVKPSVSISSLNTASEKDYTLKANVNTPGWLTVKLNGTILRKQMEVTEAGTVELPVELTKGNNSIQLIFEPDATQDITNSDTIINNYTVAYKTYGEASEVIYISPDGTANGDGSREKPLDLVSAINFCQPGQSIYALGGTYVFKSSMKIPHGNNGTAEKMKELSAAPDNTEEVVFDFNGTTATFAVSGDYWHVLGISVTRGGGMRVGGNHNLIELCKTYNNKETGLQISRTDSASTIEEWPSYNTILNCDSYNNRDASDNNADGFAAKLTVGEGNVFKGCVSFFNVDDGWDLFAKASAIGSVKLYDCIAYANGYCIDENGKVVQTKGDGNGFKLGGSGVPVAHEIHDSISFGNGANGYTNNSDPIYNVYHCIGYNNGGKNLEYHAYTNATPQVTVEGFVSYADSSISDFTLMGNKVTGSDYADASVVKPGNYLYDSKAGKTTDADGVEIAGTNFADLSRFIQYCTNQLRYERDEEGNIIYGDFLRFIEPEVTVEPEEGSAIKGFDASDESIKFVYVNEDGSDGEVVTNAKVVIKAEDSGDAPNEEVPGLAEKVNSYTSTVIDPSAVKVSYYDIAAYIGTQKVELKEGGIRMKFPYPEGFGQEDQVIVLHYTEELGEVERESDGFWIEARGFSPYTFIFLKDVDTPESPKPEEPTPEPPKPEEPTPEPPAPEEPAPESPKPEEPAPESPKPEEPAPDNDKDDGSDDAEDTDAKQPAAKSPKTYDDSDYTMTFSRNSRRAGAVAEPTMAAAGQQGGSTVFWYVCVLAMAAAGVGGTVAYCRKKKK